MRKIYTKELGPKPVPLIVPGEAITEEDVSLMHLFANRWLKFLYSHVLEMLHALSTF